MAKFTPVCMLVVFLMSGSALHAQDMSKPLGKWERKIGKNRVLLTIEDNRLHVSYAGDKPGVLHADYAMTRDGLIYGAVTSVECDEEEEADALKTLFDAPFSFRFRIDEGALIIHDAKSHDADSKDELWNGRFKAAGAPTRAAIVPSSYVFPMTSTPSTPPPPTPLGTSFNAPTGAPGFGFQIGSSR